MRSRFMLSCKLKITFFFILSFHIEMLLGQTDYLSSDIDISNHFLSENIYYVITDSINKEVYIITTSLDGDIVIPENITSPIDGVEYKVTGIAPQAFKNMDNIISVTVPQSIKTIGSSAFMGCSKLSKITIGVDVNVGDGMLFMGCDSLKTAGPIGSGCNFEFGWTDTIPQRIFSFCFKEVTLPEGVTNIPFEAFAFSVIEEISLPSTLCHIGDKAFLYARNLKKIVIPKEVKTIGEAAFAFCEKLTSVELPDQLSNIPDACFKQCESLCEINLPDALVSIGDLAFEKCALKKIVLPENLIQIGNLAFCECDSLKDIYNHSVLPQLISDDCFLGCHNIILHVKRNLNVIYKHMSVWNNLTIIDDIYGL